MIIYFLAFSMHHTAPTKLVLGQGMVKVGHGTEQVHAYLMLEFDSAVCCDITHCLGVM